MNKTLLNTVYNNWARNIGANDWVNEYKEEFGKLTLNQFIEEWKELLYICGEGSDWVDVCIRADKHPTSYPAVYAVSNLDTVCRTPFWNILSQENIRY